jgi:heme exporter protein A
LNLRVHHLSKAFGSHWALRDISFELRSGERIALLGQNGAGKTTLLKLLSALLYPTSGEIELDGDRLGSGASRLRSTVGYLAPADHLYENLTVKENLRLMTSLYGRKKTDEELENAILRSGLAGWSGAFLLSLSAGMRCRAAIAKWILLEPKLFFLDEPYGPLDGNGVTLLEELISAFTTQDCTVILATHHIARALNLCSRALLLNQGRLLFDGTQQQARENFDRLFADLVPRGEPWSS